MKVTQGSLLIVSWSCPIGMNIWPPSETIHAEILPGPLNVGDWNRHHAEDPPDHDAENPRDVGWAECRSP